MGILGNAAGFGGLSNLPIIGGLLGTGNGQGNAAPSMPTAPAASPGYGPQAWGGWPVPQSDPNATPQQSFSGNLGQPGQGENFFGANSGMWTGPNALGTYWDQNQGKFGASGPADQYWAGLAGKMNAPNVSQNAQTAWNQFQGSVPANTDPYYNNAIRLASNDINSQMAARGLYGGGTGVAPVNEAITNIRAQQAHDNAQYGLQRAGLGGQLAQGADQSSLGALQGQLGWLTGLGGLGLGVQSQDLQRLLGGGALAGQTAQQQLSGLNSGMGAALGAQQALENRGQNFFNNNLQMGQGLSSALQSTYMAQLQAEMELASQQIQAALGYGQTAANQSANNQANAQQGITSLIGLGGGNDGKGLFGGLGSIL